jgi:hypothetical protein
MELKNMVVSDLPINADIRAGKSMLHIFINHWLVWVILLLGGLSPITLEAREFRSTAATGQEMKENPCPLCGQPWRGRVDLEMVIPEKLPIPKNLLWIHKLRMALAMEKLAKARFEADQRNFGVTNPYLYVLPQVDQHIAWIGKLFSAYALLPQVKNPPVLSFETADTLLQTFKNGRKFEADLALQYVWLLKHAEDKVTKRVLNVILTQTNINIDLFQNDIRIIEIEGSMVPSLL